ncbi:uncharacterized protein PHACADRAFT_192498 [Phanerochaete carnosa HHB-10118-sp]|uniref:Uncharacterized protein n=1 Tax=Phanerochaete carnosa (strain HHB-10118-sp) TaxID=650164 RepID=K5VB35_PHACS|nr:uncharacterized protein PHACADRAFT_192498 [Phanerochaete carnosa HHB-10118-sp]EKM60096.1 hypothetical protein PHACADRAFT_192498 [Phanerochaete carnosa HHB-10118-sp]
MYPPAILPMLAVYVSVAMEAIGDITALAEVSRIAVNGEEFDTRIQDGVLSDGVGGLISALCTVTPPSIFAQNNGVTAITRCLGRLSCNTKSCDKRHHDVSICVGRSVGIRVLSYHRITRRDRFILAATLSFSIGNLIVPSIVTHFFDGNAVFIAAVFNQLLPQENEEDGEDEPGAEVIDIEEHRVRSEKEKYGE